MTAKNTSKPTKEGEISAKRMKEAAFKAFEGMAKVEGLTLSEAMVSINAAQGKLLKRMKKKWPKSDLFVDSMEGLYDE